MTKCDLQIKTSAVGAKHDRHNVATVLWQEFFCEKTIDVALDERCFPNTKISDDDNFRLSLCLLVPMSL